MRITDLLDRRSVSLTAAPKTKSETLEKIVPVLIYPVVGILIMGLLMTFIVEPVMGGINTGLNNALTGMGSSSKVILGIVLGGMMAIDMGGPFNKAAYVFGTAAIAAGNYVECKTNFDFFKDSLDFSDLCPLKDNWRNYANKLVYTGAVDEYFYYKLGSWTTSTTNRT